MTVESVITSNMILFRSLFFVLWSLYFFLIYSSSGLFEPSPQVQQLSTKLKVQSSDLNVEYLSDDQHARHLQEHGCSNQVMSAWILPEHAHVIRIHCRNHNRNKDRQPTKQ